MNTPYKKHEEVQKAKVNKDTIYLNHFISFVSNSWSNVISEERRLYLKNAYRVLLTRDRQGMVMFIPQGSDTDPSRKHEYYDRTYEYLRYVGVEEI